MNNLVVFRGAKVLITGHTGFKGAWLSLWLCQLGADVYGISLDIPTQPSHYAEADIGDRLEDYREDIRDIAALHRRIEEIQPDFVFHLAAQSLVKKAYTDPLDTWQTNTMGTINLLEALRVWNKACVAIFITSDKCYDNVEWVWGYRETDQLGGKDPYSGSKGASELAIRSYVSSYFPQEGRVRIGIGRAGNVIGGGDWAADRIVPDCVRAWSLDEAVSLRNPRATRPWQHVLEPLSGYLNLAIHLQNDNSLHGEPFNFGPASANNYSVGDLVGLMAKHWDKVQWKDISESDSGPYESGLLKLNCDKALYHLGWHPTWDIDDTVIETITWYRNYYKDAESGVSDFSLAQIERYVALARERKLLWAQ